jgi:CRP-like cAMP-binding protein
MAGILPFTTEDDERALLAAARSVACKDGEVILAEGHRPRALFVLREGTAGVERRYDDYTLEVSSLNAGEVFGEISFVDEEPASASVVARGPCRVDVVDEQAIDTLMQRDPGFASRFYRSIARVLSTRLRATTAQGLSEFSWGTGFSHLDSEIGAPPASWGGGSPLRQDQESDTE